MAAARLGSDEVPAKVVTSGTGSGSGATALIIVDAFDAVEFFFAGAPVANDHLKPNITRCSP